MTAVFLLYLQWMIHFFTYLDTLNGLRGWLSSLEWWERR